MASLADQIWTPPNNDNLFKVENVLDLSVVVAGYGYGLHLSKASVGKPFTFIRDYQPIGVPAAGRRR